MSSTLPELIEQDAVWLAAEARLGGLTPEAIDAAFSNLFTLLLESCPQSGEDGKG